MRSASSRYPMARASRPSTSSRRQSASRISPWRLSTRTNMQANSQTRNSQVISPEEAAQELLRRRQARKSLEQFTSYTTPRWLCGRPHKVICGHLDRIERGEIDRLMLLLPPQHGKSTITSKRYPAFTLAQNPLHDVISASATHELA